MKVLGPECDAVGKEWLDSGFILKRIQEDWLAGKKEKEMSQGGHQGILPEKLHEQNEME